MIARKIALFSYILLCSCCASAQQKLTKKEILKDWIKRHPKPAKENALRRVDAFQGSLHRQIYFRLQSFRLQRIDTFAILSIEYPGYFGINDSCNELCGKYYVFWRYQNKDYVEKVDGCFYFAAELDSAVIFNYYADHATSIQDEEIMPVISNNAKRNGQPYYSVEDVDHEPKYTLYYQLNDYFNERQFTYDGLTNRESLFYTDNISSCLYKWFRLMEKETGREWQKWTLSAEAPTLDKWVNLNRSRGGGDRDATKWERKRNITLQGDTMERFVGFNYQGQAIQEQSWLHGKKNGIQLEYFPNGVVKQMVYYLDDRPWDVISLTDTTGKFYFPGTLHNGNGTMYFYDYYYSNGPVNFATYKNGRMEGPYLRYFGDEVISGNVAYKKGAVLYKPVKRVTCVIPGGEILTMPLDSSNFRQLFFDYYQPDMKLLSVVDDSTEAPAREFKYIGFGFGGDPAIIPIGEWKKVSVRTGKTISTATFDDNGNPINLRRYD